MSRISRTSLGESHRTFDDSCHAVGLREISPQLESSRVQIFRQQTVPIARRQSLLVKCPRFVAARTAHARQRLDVPEGADKERVLRIPEVVLFNVAIDEIAMTQVTLDR